MKVVDIATQLYSEIGDPTDTSIAAVAYWLRTNVGELNNHLYENFSVDDATSNGDYEIKDEDSVEININAISILKKMYIIHRYGVLLRSQLSLINTDTFLEVRQDDTSVRRMNKNDIAKNISQIKSEEYHTLQHLINAYRVNKSTPLQIAGDDTEAGFFPSLDSIQSSRIYTK